MKKLIITNGDIAAKLIAEAGLADPSNILPWRDILHVGPVPITDSFEELCVIRSQYLHKALYASWPDVTANFEKTSNILSNHKNYPEIEIWLEHDLYDQLQLLQILDYFAQEARLDGLSLVQADDFLGHQSAKSICQFEASKAPITMAQLEIANEIWSAFRQPDPVGFSALSSQYHPTLPFMQSAMHRMLDELPSLNYGLGRSQLNILKVIEANLDFTLQNLFEPVAEMEEARFLGSSSFCRLADQLHDCSNPAIAGLNGRFSYNQSTSEKRDYLKSLPVLTEFGRNILSGDNRFCDENIIDYWWGGTHLTNENMWFWDETRAIPG